MRPPSTANAPIEVLHQALEAGYFNAEGIYSETKPQKLQPGLDIERHCLEVKYDPRTAVGLTLLEIENHELGLYLGSGWDGFSILAARKCRAIVDVNDSYTLQRQKQILLGKEHIDNFFLLNCDPEKDLKLFNLFDFAVVNGGLKALPDAAASRVKRRGHLKYLQQIYSSLTCNGRLYLAAQNKCDYQSYIRLNGSNINPRYSFSAMEKLLKEAGFRNVRKYAVFPDIHCPRKIIPMKRVDSCSYMPIYNITSNGGLLVKIFRKIRTYLDIIVFKKAKMYFLAPGYILLAQK